MSDRHSESSVILGSDALEKISKMKVLMVGAGGIGCELLKNLVMAGVGRIEIVDLDTIDLSNLNRQFLFQREHIKQSKAHVARKAALQFNPAVDIQSHHSSIFDDQFDVQWFKSFDVVLSALDNVAARRHVNFMCLAADVPLVESGTAGYRGQVSVHKKSLSACYDCFPKDADRKTFPICTIRSTPSAPIHCIVWAKDYLFSSLFGSSEDASAVDKQASSAENKNEVEELQREAEELQKLRDSMGKKEYTKFVFEKVFKTDIDRSLALRDSWKETKPPVSLKFAAIQADMKKKRHKKPDSSTMQFDQQPWSLFDNFDVLLQSMKKLSSSLLELRKTDASSTLSFDKDDEDALNFVTAAANLRAECFGIQQKSRFDVKEMAGNIIPAIATTNAIVAGMIVMLVFRIIAGDLKGCQNTFISFGGQRTHLLSNEPLVPPNKDCSVCSINFLALKINTNVATLADILDGVICNGTFGKHDASSSEGLGLKGDITIQRDQALIYDVEFDDNLPKTLETLSINNKSRLVITNDNDDDEEQNVTVLVFIEHLDSFDKTKFELIGSRVLQQRPKPKIQSEPDSSAVASSSKEHDVGESDGSKKRAISDEDLLVPNAKYPRLDDHLVVLEDDDVILV